MQSDKKKCICIAVFSALPITRAVNVPQQRHPPLPAICHQSPTQTPNNTDTYPKPILLHLKYNSYGHQSTHQNAPKIDQNDNFDTPL